ncbi:MAG: efflux RND transporter periplasmic adaptor subunit [Kofleriaceae bacterium]
MSARPPEAAAPARGAKPTPSATAPAEPSTEPPSGARGSDPAIMPLPDGMGAIDPMQIPVPPELAAPIYSWVRRLALQADLAGADRVLRDALADMTSSLTVSIVYPGADGLWTLGPDDEIPRDPQPIVAVGRARRAVIASHTALIPVLTSSEVIAVVVLTRNPRNPGYHPMEQMAAIALARESAAILHHLAVQHLQSAAEIEADKGGLYRGEALEAHRTRGSEGVLVQLSPAWVRRTYPLLVATLLIGIVASIFITVPTYSSGHGYIKFEGTPVVAPLGGNVEKVLVQRGQQVKRGTLLAKLNSAQEAIALTQATRDYENAMYQYLVDQTDEQTKKTLAGALTQMERAQATEEQRLVRAPVDGTVSDVRVAIGTQLNPGDSMMTIVAPGTDPEVVAFLPGKDRPRLRNDMEMQVELSGFTKGREHVKLTSISTEIVSGEEIMRQILGPKLAESFRQLNGGTWVIVKGRLPSRTFRADNETHFYYHGLTARTEVKIKDKPFLLTLLPALEKIVP